jgi:CheY-like chemotaxis protein
VARILIVDDEPLIAMLAEEWLQEMGHTPVGPAHDLAGALVLAESEVDGAIIDVTLGRETGYPVAKALAARGVPFAFATGHAETQSSPEYQAAALLRKPFEFEAFRTAVETLLAG